MEQRREQVTDGVHIPQETVLDSTAKKKAHRTLRQLPIYRDMANLKYMVVCLYDIVPRKLTKYIDSMLVTVCEAKKCVGLAESTRNSEERAQYLTLARVFMEDTQDDVTILFKKNVISKNIEKQMKGQVRSVVAQCVAWRDYTNGQGVNDQ
jgi:hypothetical protein